MFAFSSLIYYHLKLIKDLCKESENQRLGLAVKIILRLRKKSNVHEFSLQINLLSQSYNRKKREKWRCERNVLKIKVYVK